MPKMCCCLSEIQKYPLSPRYRGIYTVIGPGNVDLYLMQFGAGGQCAAVPCRAIWYDDTELVWEALEDPNKYVVVQTAPAFVPHWVSVLICLQAFGQGRMVTARRLGLTRF